MGPESQSPTFQERGGPLGLTALQSLNPWQGPSLRQGSSSHRTAYPPPRGCGWKVLPNFEQKPDEGAWDLFFPIHIPASGAVL